MEVDRTAFWGRLLSILVAISEAHFVSIDLELSGVASKNLGGRARQATLEERYAETKEAAERYTILQIGVTCAYQDLTREVYVLRPYNFNLNPSFEERLDLERIFSFQSGAVDFLLAHGFQMNLPFTHGVPYLSRDEARRAKEIAKERLNRDQTGDIQLRETDVQSLAFVERIRNQIQIWIRTKKPSPDSLWITGIAPSGESDAGSDVELTRFEKRLVHQLVRAEFKEYTTISRQGGIKIIRTDPVREQDFRNARMKAVREQVNRQTGFRWIIEALAGGDLDKLDARHLAFNPQTGAPKAVDLNNIHSQLGRANDALSRRRPVLVGHNMFTDLIYLYKTFVGVLPDTVKQFSEKLHQLFPNIVDTKWLATQADSDIPSKSSLEEIEEKLRNVAIPKIEVHPEHPKYMTLEPFHEAGYDAYLTARVMILLSAKLEAGGTYISPAVANSNSEAYATAPEEVGGVSLQANLTPIEESGEIRGLTSTPSSSNQVDAVAVKKRKKKNNNKKTKPTSSAGPSSSFASANLYATLEQLTLDEAENKPTSIREAAPIREPTSPPTSKLKESTPWVAETPNSTLSFVANGTTYYVPASPNFNQPRPDPSTSIFGKSPVIRIVGLGKNTQQEQGQPLALMPPYESDFWRIYGNKLRVYGTEEQVLVLGEEDGDNE